VTLRPIGKIARQIVSDQARRMHPRPAMLGVKRGPRGLCPSCDKHGLGKEHGGLRRCRYCGHTTGSNT